MGGVGAGAGGVVLVEGEQGIGKSALLRAGLDGAAAGCRVLWAAAGELEQPIPLGLMAERLGAAVPEPAGAVTPAGAGGFAGDAGLARMPRMLAGAARLRAVWPVVPGTPGLARPS